MLTGELIESRTAEGARYFIESLIKLTPTWGRLVRSRTEVEEEVAASELAVGDVIRIRPGDNVAADGLIVSGQGSFNQATITGESLPVDKKAGDEAFAGTQNLTGVLEIKVSRAGEDTTLGRVRELILAAEKTKLPIQKIVDQYMGFYTPLVLVIGALVWAFTHDLNRVIGFFVISCPCAFILATPTAMVAALSAAARLGILIKNVADIEAAAKINAFIFDKTGTLTTGQLAVSRLAPIGETKPAELLRVRGVGGKIQQPSNGQGARANYQAKPGCRWPSRRRISPNRRARREGRDQRRESFRRPGTMAEGQRRDRGLRENGGPQGNGRLESDFRRARRPVRRVGGPGRPDPRRGEGIAGRVEGTGVRRIAMISGDRQAVVTRVAGEIGCEEAKGDCLPQTKVEFVRGDKSQGLQGGRRR